MVTVGNGSLPGVSPVCQVRRGPAVVVFVDVVMVVWIIYLVVEHFGFRETEYDHSSRQNDGQKAQSEGLPSFERYKSHRKGDDGRRFEFQSQNERHHDFLDETSSCEISQIKL